MRTLLPSESGLGTELWFFRFGFIVVKIGRLSSVLCSPTRLEPARVTEGGLDEQSRATTPTRSSNPFPKHAWGLRRPARGVMMSRAAPTVLSAWVRSHRAMALGLVAVASTPGAAMGAHVDERDDVHPQQRAFRNRRDRAYRSDPSRVAGRFCTGIPRNRPHRTDRDTPHGASRPGAGRSGPGQSGLPRWLADGPAPAVKAPHPR